MNDIYGKKSKNKSHKQKTFKMPKPSSNVKANNKWTVMVVILSFFLSIAFSAVTSVLMNEMSIIWAFVILFAIIAINVGADIIGTSVMNAEESPFHSLARRRVSGAKQSISIMRQAPQISNLCCDVIDVYKRQSLSCSFNNTKLAASDGAGASSSGIKSPR